MKKILILFIFLTQFLVNAWSQTFVVKQIRIEGLQRSSAATVESYLGIKRGQVLTPSKTANILRTLYKTGFFDQISVSKSNNTLIIHVVERPTIGQLKISGNSVIPTDKLTAVMKELDVAEGRVYNPATLEKIKKSLLSQYYQLGRYNARVNIETSPMSRNRIFVKIDISEGLVAKVKRISIIGNHAFDEKTLVKQLDLTTTGLFTFITQSDRYSEEKLEASLEMLRNYYLDHGYVRIEIKSSHAEITPDRKSVYVTVVIEEGVPYTIKDYSVTGQFIVPRGEILNRIHIKRGEVFSRQKILDSEKEISKLLGDRGYMFATISLHPQVNDKSRELILVFDIKAGKRVYIRKVTFADNNHTNDEVLRREIQQMEAAPVSTSKLEDSKRRLLSLPYIKDVDMSVQPVPEVDDKIDVNYKVKEETSAQATFKVGYSGVQGVLFGAGLNQKNFLGTGNELGFNFQHSKYEQIFTIDYTNPYYTPDGISRSFNLAISRVDPGAISNLTNTYTTNEIDLGVLYGIPIGQEEGVFNRIQAGVSYQNILINTVKRTSVSNQVNSYLDNYGRRFQALDLKLGYSRNSLDKSIFPTTGVLQTLFLDTYIPVSKQTSSFYTLNYHGVVYRPITDQFIFLSRVNLGYGNAFSGARNFPFFKNFYSGGIDSVRGFEGYTLGPKDSNGKSMGGQILADASLGLIFPNFVSDSVRTSVFVDGGNVYSILNNRRFGGNSTNSGPIRYSAGVELDWLTPMGPIKFTLAKTLNSRHGDSLKAFDFALGANF